MSPRWKFTVLGVLLTLGLGSSLSCAPGPAGAPPPAPTRALPPARECRGVLIIDGIFDPKGSKLLRLDPIHCFKRQSGPVPNQERGIYVVQTTYADGRKVKLYFDALVADDAGHVQHGFFEIVQPVDGAIAQLRIATSDGTMIFATVSGNEIIPPT